MANFARIQHKIDRGLGKAAKHLGPPYSVYRVEATSYGDYPGGWTQVSASIPAFLRRVTDAKIQSALLASGTMWFDVIANVEPLLLGDVFQLADGPYSPGVAYGQGATSVAGTSQFVGFGLAWHAPVDEPVGARLDRRIRVYRQGGQPVQAEAGAGPIWRGSIYQAAPLVLQAGLYSFLDPDSGAYASLVPAGIASTDRPPRGHLIPPVVPGDMQIPRYFVYLPPLPGYTPAEGDRLVEETGARYVVTNPYHQEAGVVGYQLGVERRMSED